MRQLASNINSSDQSPNESTRAAALGRRKTGTGFSVPSPSPIGLNAAGTDASDGAKLTPGASHVHCPPVGPEHAGTRPAVEYNPRSSADLATRETLQSALRAVLMREQLQHQGMGAAEVNALMKPVQMNSSQTGEADSTTANYVGVIVLCYGWFTFVIAERSIMRLQVELKTRALASADKDIACETE